MLYLVATPIGNMGDITQRALEVLRTVDLIASEDTRKTGLLLKRFEIKQPQLAFHEHNERQAGERIVELLRQGKSVAVVTNAGTPGISDPGFLLVKEARAAGVPVVPIPGPSAVITALSAAGVPADRFLFEGFLPIKPGRRLNRLRALRELEITLVFYESPHRILATLAAVNEVFGAAPLVVARELTKQFEEIVEGTAAALAERFAGGTARGEFTVLIPHTKMRMKGEAPQADEEG
jgi:16S rRNA (cytidine1402-2'-O)-methyltransferase